jgi:Tat protein translocase TatB subunit
MHFSISELLVIVIVALLVIKPERLPETARTIGRVFQWFRKHLAKLKQEIDETSK